MVLAITGAVLTSVTWNAYCAHQYHGPQDTVYARVLFLLGPTALTVSAAIWTHQRPWAFLRLIALAVGMTVLGLAAFFMLEILTTGINCNGT